MKKAYLLLITVLFLFSNGCGSQEPQPALVIGQNTFFFPDGITSAEYSINYEMSYESFLEKLGENDFDERLIFDRTEIILHINELAKFDNGAVYELKLASAVSPVRGNVIGYFYVDMEEIRILRM